VLTLNNQETSLELAQAIGTLDPKGQPDRVKKSGSGAAVEVARLVKKAAGHQGRYAGVLVVEVYAQVQGTTDAANAQVQVVRAGIFNDNAAWSVLGTKKTEDFPGATLTDLAITISTTTGDLVVSVGSASKALEVYGVVRVLKLPQTYDGIPET
jgi:hypothetical protein